jgi:subtilisin family serine protease
MPLRSILSRSLTAGLVALGVWLAPPGAVAVPPTASSSTHTASDGARTSTTGWQDKVQPSLLKSWQKHPRADLFVDLAQRADLSAARSIADWGERGEYVVRELRRTAADSQREIRAMLDREHVSYTPFWAANTILVHDATSAIARDLVAEQGVRRLYDVASFDPPEVTPVKSVRTQAAAEWGIASIKADQVWSDFGDTGEGIVIANIDTGVDYQHPALVGAYRGNNGDGTFTHDYNWFDPAGVCGPAGSGPCDNQGHGTHTMGTMVGSDAGGTSIGVAPGARWIAAKGCPATEAEGCTLDALISSGQWMLAPTDAAGEHPRPDLRPQIINNSWGSDTGPFTDPFYKEVVDAWNASGIFGVFSNGNDGAHGCDTAGSPADNAGSYAVGAYDVDNHIAPFSSRGPGENGQVRPNISAPGVAIRSSIPGGGYASANGTSMASPHVSGAVALMWSAAPSLVGDVNGTRALLDQTAVDTDDRSCGGTAENNNVFGEGRLDVLAAVDASPVGDTGTLSGVVTNADTGAPLANATVHASSADYARTTTTDADGRYSLGLTTGTYELTVHAYGYADGGSSGAEVVKDQDTTVDLGLDKLPSVIVSGTVTDGSGQGWPMYAAVKVDGYPGGPVYTDPSTGAYEVELPASTTYAVEISTPYDGYQRATEQLQVGTEDTSADFHLITDDTDCVAPGYEPAHAGLFESFDDGTLPDGWSLETTVGDGWQFDDPGARGNLTGGDGKFAIIDSAAGARLEDGRLVSPTIDLTDSTEPVISFRTHLLMTRGVTEIDLSTDDGSSWQNVWTRSTTLRGPVQEQVPVPQAAGDSDVRVRFHYRNDLAGNGYWQLDDVLVGQRDCAPLDGGLVVGRVTDDRTGRAVEGATVWNVDHPEERAVTVETPNDSALDGGFYWLFSSHPGQATFSARHVVDQYAAKTSTVDVTSQGATRADFALSAGQIEVASSSVQGTAELGGETQVQLTLTNTGTAPASYDLAERSYAKTAHRPEDATWERRADMPIARTDGLAAVHDGKLYYVGGYLDRAGSAQRDMVYDIGADTWSFTDFHPVRGKAAGGFIGDKMYVAGGWDQLSRTESSTLVYDPIADSFSEGAEMPTAVAAAGYAILDGKLYVIGGRTEDQPNQGSSQVQVYDPATDTWSQVADYPEPASWQSCGTIDGLIYCAGGQAPTIEHSNRAYVYHPDTDTWYRIADLPQTVTFAATAAPNGLLMVSGGQVGGVRSNQGFYYDPGTDTWGSLPNSIFDVYRLAGTCGFYKLGGTQGQPGTFPWVEQLSGFDDCDTSAGDRVPWMSVDSPHGTLQPGESTEVTVTLDASAAGLDQPADVSADLLVHEDTPQHQPALPVTLHATAPSSWGHVTGTVTGLGRCDRPTGPLPGARVLIDAAEPVTVVADSDGRYGYWLPQPPKPVIVTARLAGWLTADRSVTVRAGRTSTADLALRTNAPCASVTPKRLSFDLKRGQRRSRSVTLRNHGAASYRFAVAERRNGSDVPWLRLGRATRAVVRADSTRSFTVKVDSHRLARRHVYRATLVVTTTDPRTPRILVPVTVRVR